MQAHATRRNVREAEIVEAIAARAARYIGGLAGATRLDQMNMLAAYMAGSEATIDVLNVAVIE